MLLHHGRSLGHPDTSALLKYWGPTPTCDPVESVRALLDEARSHWPEAFAASAEPLPNSNPFWQGVTGLLQLADWMGSDDREDAFPFAVETDGPRLSFARARAATLVTQVGFNADHIRTTMRPPDFAAIFGFAARPIQAAAADAPGPVVVLESETGSGKTEAALL
jgi:CRISPR-associated endonuclease/helicase Cas3